LGVSTGKPTPNRGFGPELVGKKPNQEEVTALEMLPFFPFFD
jgi:hypothetical protein